ncbi:MAG: hypothetical protein HKN24_13770 [Acidimicrobiales bacterium]|nr:hypothetical protein [Acidimicrobiales bacterium]
MYRILYRFLASLARLAVRSGRSQDMEILVLRHQLALFGRHHAPPTLTDHLEPATARTPRHRLIDHHNTHRPHRSLEQQPPLGNHPRVSARRDPAPPQIVRSTRCDGIINEYRNAA